MVKLSSAIQIVLAITLGIQSGCDAVSLMTFHYNTTAFSSSEQLAILCLVESCLSDIIVQLLHMNEILQTLFLRDPYSETPQFNLQVGNIRAGTYYGCRAIVHFMGQALSFQENFCISDANHPCTAISSSVKIAPSVTLSSTTIVSNVDLTSATSIRASLTSTLPDSSNTNTTSTFTDSSDTTELTITQFSNITSLPPLVSPGPDTLPSLNTPRPGRDIFVALIAAFSIIVGLLLVLILLIVATIAVRRTKKIAANNTQGAQDRDYEEIDQIAIPLEANERARHEPNSQIQTSSSFLHDLSTENHEYEDIGETLKIFDVSHSHMHDQIGLRLRVAQSGLVSAHHFSTPPSHNTTQPGIVDTVPLQEGNDAYDITANPGYQHLQPQGNALQRFGLSQAYERVPRVNFISSITIESDKQTYETVQMYEVAQTYEGVPDVDIEQILFKDKEKTYEIPQMYERVPNVDIAQILSREREKTYETAQVYEVAQTYERVPNVQILFKEREQTYGIAQMNETAVSYETAQTYKRVPNVNIEQILERKLTKAVTNKMAETT